MDLYQHEFDTIEKYLHHRPPYLMVDEIKSVTDSEIVTEKKIKGDEFYMQGHFPGAPVVPGAMMQELATQSAGALIAARYNPMQDYVTEDPYHNKFALGVLVKVRQARYRGFARTGDTLVARVKLNERIEQMFDFSAAIRLDDRVVARLSFLLTNIESKVLQGD